MFLSRNAAHPASCLRASKEVVSSRTADEVVFLASIGDADGRSLACDLDLGWRLLIQLSLCIRSNALLDCNFDWSCRDNRNSTGSQNADPSAWLYTCHS